MVLIAEVLLDDVHILVAAAGEIDDDIAAGGQFLGMIKDPGQGMGRLQGGQDALCLGEALEGGQGASVADHAVLRAAGLLEVSVLGADAGIVKAGGHGVRGLDLAFGSLQKERAVAVKDARGAEVQGRGVEAAGFAAACGLGADKAHGLAPEEATKNANSVGTAAHAGDHGVRKLAGLLENLLPGFLAHDALELGDQFREGSRTCGCAEAVVGGLLVGDPAAQSFINGVLQSAGAAVHGVHSGAEHFHAHDVHGLALGVLGAHEDGAFEAEARGRGGRSHAVLSGAGFGDEGCLAHFLGEQGLTGRIVHLVGARVE